MSFPFSHGVGVSAIQGGGEEGVGPPLDPPMVYDTKNSLENDIGPENSIMINRRRIFTSFQIDAKCTIRQPVYFLFFIFSAVQTSKTSFQIAEECTIKRPRF